MTRCRIRDLCRVNPGVPGWATHAEDAQIPFLPMERVWTDRLDLSETRAKEQVDSGYTRFAEGDILVPKITPTFEAGRTAIAHPLPGGIGAGTTELHVLRPNPGVHPRWLLHFLNNGTFLRRGHADMYGVAGQKRISEEFVKNYPVSVPTIEEQQRIANYLDAETARIDELIAEQERQLRLIAEHRHALLSRAVRARLGGETSSLEGALEPLPEGWKLVPLRTVATIQSGLTLGKTYEGPLQERPYLRVANVQDGYIDTQEVAVVALPAQVATRHELQADDVLINEGNGNPAKLGRGAIWSGSIAGCLHQNHVFAVRCSQAIRPRWLEHALASTAGRAYFIATSTQVGIATTSKAKVGRFPLPLPPLTTQDQMLSEVGSQLARLDMIQTETRQQIDLLREHRQALITTAVTQGIDGLPGMA